MIKEKGDDAMMKIIKFVAAIAFLLTFTACSMKQEGNRTVIKEPGKSITVIENENTETDQPSIFVEKIDRYEGMEITDWFDEQTVVLAKENPELGKMSLLENAEFYPRSIYLYHLDTKEYETVKAPTIKSTCCTVNTRLEIPPII